MSTHAAYSTLKTFVERFEDRSKTGRAAIGDGPEGNERMLSTSQRFATEIAKLYGSGVGRGF